MQKQRIASVSLFLIGLALGAVTNLATNDATEFYKSNRVPILSFSAFLLVLGIIFTLWTDNTSIPGTDVAFNYWLPFCAGIGGLIGILIGISATTDFAFISISAIAGTLIGFGVFKMMA